MVLVALDFDATLSETDPTVRLGREYGVGTEIRGLAEQGRTGEVALGPSLEQRVSLLEGMPEPAVDDALERVGLRDGAGELIADLRRSGVTVAVLTASPERAVAAALEGAGVAVDHLVANRLVVADGALTGEIEGPLLEDRKGEVLGELAVEEGVDPSLVVAVGDGAIDLGMLQVAGTAVGFDPVPLVADHCDVVVTSIHRLRLYLEQHDVLRPDAG